MAVDLLDLRVDRYADWPASGRLDHRRRRVANRLPAPGDSCRRPPGAVDATVRLAPVPVTDPATRSVGVPSCQPRRVADHRSVYRRRRAAAVGVLAVVLVCSWMATRTALGRIGGGPLATTGAPGGVNPAAVRVWIVRPGDTLWTIAEAVDPNGDVRPLVDRLAAEARGSAIYPGESIALPGR